MLRIVPRMGKSLRNSYGLHRCRSTSKSVFFLEASTLFDCWLFLVSRNIYKHMVRLTLEIDWVKRFDGYVSLWDDGLNSTTELRQNYLKSSKMGYCKDGEYIPLQFPYSNETANNGYLDLIP
mmetsp:Transcript_8138/g.9368  ORF Transcript_8138/g.9368 Transcript_8138/m.9368 type:complete len:122 (+) Transcript_8138:1332-1697(+)